MPNNIFTFIHTADLHLGGGIEGLDQASGQIASFVKRAPYEALERIVDLCVKEKAHALLLAGDVYNPENDLIGSLKALSHAFSILEEKNIKVFMAHGNHDPAEVSFSWQWPSNVTVFGTQEVESYPVYGENTSPPSPSGSSGSLPHLAHLASLAPLAIVHGISHASTVVSENLALKFAPALNKVKETPAAPFSQNVPQVGLLHCSVISAKNAAGQGIYAPCNLQDLISAPINYWALGHIHKGAKLQDEPLIYYSGNPQGLHIKETGPKGCLVVKLARDKQEVSFRPLAPLRWEELHITLPAEAPFNTLEEPIINAIIEMQQNILAGEAASGVPSPHSGSSHYEIKGIILRLILEGATALHKDLHLREREEGLLQDLREALAKKTAGKNSFIWIKDVILKTKPLQNIELAKTRNDLLGETLRLIDKTKDDKEKLHDLFTSKDALGSLYAHKGAQKAGLTPPDEAELQNLLEEAALRCLELLSPEGQ